MRAKLLCVALLIMAACARPTPQRPPDPAYHFRANADFEITFSERLTHEPRASEKPEIYATMAKLKGKVIEVRPDGVAHLIMQPIYSQVSINTSGAGPAIYDNRYDRPLDYHKDLEGSRYLTLTHIVVDQEGWWRRDFRGTAVPPDFLSRERWGKLPPDLRCYPQAYAPKIVPVFLSTYIPADWRIKQSWQRSDLIVPQYPMAGSMPILWNIKITKREGSLLYLSGEAGLSGKITVTPVHGEFQIGESTKELHLVHAVYEARFDLDLGLPLEGQVDLAWETKREVDRIGAVLSDDGQKLTFKLRPITP